MSHVLQKASHIIIKCTRMETIGWLEFSGSAPHSDKPEGAFQNSELAGRTMAGPVILT